MSSKLKFIEPVLEAIAKLAERNGSSAKDILNYVWKSDKRTVKRNLALQVRKALKQAVVQGFTRLCGGRYKVSSYPIKKLDRAVEKEKNNSGQVHCKNQTRHNKLGKITKKVTKGNQSNSKNHAAQKSKKAKKKPKPSTK